MESANDKTCEMCYKIICGGCGWEANDKEVVMIQKEELTACPICGWQPKQHLL